MGPTLRRGALYLLFSGALHAAPLVVWIARAPLLEAEEATRIRVLDPTEEAALARVDAERAAARAVTARLVAQRAEVAHIEATRRAEAATAVARRAVERLEEARRAEAAVETVARKGGEAPKPREATEAAKREREVEEALAARLEADRAVEAAQRTAEDARVEAARAEAMKAEAVREAARVEAKRAEAVRPEVVEAEVSKADVVKAEIVKAEVPPPHEPPPAAIVEAMPPPEAPEPPDAPTAKPAPAPEELARAPEPQPKPLPKPLAKPPPPEAPTPKPEPQATVQERGAAQSGGPGNAVANWLDFVRSEGAPDATADADARFISDRNRRAPEDTRALADVARSNGQGRPEADIATRTSTATKQGDAARGTAARVDVGQPTPPPAARPIPPPAPPAPRPTPAGRTGVRVPLDPVALPYVAEAVGPAPATPGETLRLSAGEITLSPGTPGIGPSTRPSVRRAPPLPTPTEPVPSPLPASAERPKAPRPPLDDDFWSASTLPTLADPDVPATALDATAAPKPDTFLLATEIADAHGWSDLAILDDSSRLADETRYGARAHVLGPWLSTMDDTLRRRWVYPPALRALGVEGTVVVRFHVSPAGVVSDVFVQTGSGNAELDLAALAAIPARVAAMPPGSGDGLWRRVDFRYRAAAP